MTFAPTGSPTPAPTSAARHTKRPRPTGGPSLRTRLRPTRDDLVDGGFLVVLSLLALFGFHTTFAGSGYLISAAAGLALGLAIGYFATRLREPIIPVLVLTVIGYFLLGGAIALRGAPGVTGLPTASTLRTLADAGVHGWKQLLTVLPPVDSAGSYLVVPYILGLVTTSVGFTLARRVRQPFVGVLTPILLLVLVILLGTTEPAAAVLQGAVFGVVALIWLAVRSARQRPAVTNGSGRGTRLGLAVALLAAAAVGSVIAGPHLAGADTAHREVFRKHVQPPFDIRDYASPLVGFRKYTKSADVLWDAPLLKVTGLPAGQRLRIAALDDYTGAVWGASNGTAVAASNDPADSFQRVGSTIASGAKGSRRTITVTIGAAYAKATDVNAWLPTAGTPTGIVFQGDQDGSHAENLRYNLATRSGIVADRLGDGDTYTFSTVLNDSNLDPKAQAYGTPPLSSDESAFTAAAATKWAAHAPQAVAAVEAVAAHMRTTGAYSDGGNGEGQYLPGHGTGNLITFLNRSQLVGDDEQYAAAFALMSNQLGLPARVVLGAVPEADGTVKGKDVHAWVEVRVDDGQWVAVPQTAFMPDPSKKPDAEPPQQVDESNAAVVPPPNPVRPPSSSDELTQAEANALRNAQPKRSAAAAEGWQVPAFVVTIARYTVPPILLIALLCGLIVALKAFRRRRRRGRGVGTTRVAAGWREILDHARDLGVKVDRTGTRREQAAGIEGFDLARLARSADGANFSADVADQAAAEQYWREVDRTRRTMSRSVGRRRRIKAALNLSTLRPGTDTRPRTSP